MEAHRAGLVFDGTRFLEGYDVLVDSGEVVQVRPSTGQADVEHGPGCTLLPGLVDAHLHLTLDAVPDVVGGVPP